MAAQKQHEAPFFLPTVAGINPKFGAPKQEEEAPLIYEAVSFKGLGSTTLLIELLSNQNYSGAFDHLKSLTPASLDYELTQSSREHLTLTLDFFGQQLGTNKDFELAQAYLNRFLKLNSDIIVGTKLLEERVRNLRKQQQLCWGHLEKVLHANLCLINYFSKMHV